MKEYDEYDIELINIIKNKFNMTKDEAINLILECQEDIARNMDCADEILMSTLGIEPDYLCQVLMFN